MIHKDSLETVANGCAAFGSILVGDATRLSNFSKYLTHFYYFLAVSVTKFPDSSLILLLMELLTQVKRLTSE